MMHAGSQSYCSSQDPSKSKKKKQEDPGIPSTKPLMPHLPSHLTALDLPDNTETVDDPMVVEVFEKCKQVVSSLSNLFLMILEIM
jgi:hypothetical protein